MGIMVVIRLFLDVRGSQCKSLNPSRTLQQEKHRISFGLANAKTELKPLQYSGQLKSDRLHYVKGSF